MQTLQYPFGKLCALNKREMGTPIIYLFTTTYQLR